MKLIQKYIFCAAILSLGFQSTLWAQKKDSTSISQEIDVIKAYRPILEEAVKLRRSPNLDDERLFKAAPKYNFFDNRLSVNTEIRKLDAQGFEQSADSIPSNNFARLGVGNLNTLFGELYVNMGRNEKNQLGAYVKHFSQSGKLAKQVFSHQQVGVFGKAIQATNTLSGSIDYDRKAFNFYAFNPENSKMNQDFAAQNFNYLHGEAAIASNFTTDENALNYAVKADAYTFSDKFKAKESDFTLSAYLNKRIKSFNLGLNASLQTGSTNDEKTTFKSTLLKANPYIKLKANYLTLDIGANIVQESSSTKTRFMLFPAINVDLVVVPDYFEIFGEIKGDIVRNNLKSLTDENPFLNSNLMMQNVVNNLNISGGIKGTGGPGFGYKALIYHKTYTEMPLFVNNYTNPARFDVIYDFGKSTVLGMEAELSIQISNALNWTAKLNLDKYNMANETYAWFKPNFRINSNLNYQVTKDFAFNASVYGQGETKAKLYTQAPSNPYISPNKEGEKAASVKGFIDLGVGASYQITKKFGAFVKLNNLLNNQYSQFLYYPKVGINVFGGINYSF